MSLKKILCFVFILYSLFIFADGSENSDVQSPPVKETEDQNLPATENKNLSENEKDPEESEKGFYSIQSSGLTACFGDRWFFEQLDDKGRPLISVLYEKDKLIEKKNIYLQRRLS